LSEHPTLSKKCDIFLNFPRCFKNSVLACDHSLVVTVVLFKNRHADSLHRLDGDSCEQLLYHCLRGVVCKPGDCFVLFEFAKVSQFIGFSILVSKP